MGNPDKEEPRLMHPSSEDPRYTPSSFENYPIPTQTGEGLLQPDELADPSDPRATSIPGDIEIRQLGERYGELT